MNAELEAVVAYSMVCLQGSSRPGSWLFASVLAGRVLGLWHLGDVTTKGNKGVG
jgi:hypothetical protein